MSLLTGETQERTMSQSASPTASCFARPRARPRRDLLRRRARRGMGHARRRADRRSDPAHAGRGRRRDLRDLCLERGLRQLELLRRLLERDPDRDRALLDEPGRAGRSGGPQRQHLLRRLRLGLAPDLQLGPWLERTRPRRLALRRFPRDVAPLLLGDQSRRNPLLSDVHRIRGTAGGLARPGHGHPPLRLDRRTRPRRRPRRASASNGSPIASSTRSSAAPSSRARRCARASGATRATRTISARS